MLVQIKQRHIDEGVRHSPSSCPIARAIVEQCKVPGSAWVQVGVKTATLYFGRVLVGRYHLSRNAQQFARDFDAGRDVKPARFYLSDITLDLVCNQCQHAWHDIGWGCTADRCRCYATGD